MTTRSKFTLCTLLASLSTVSAYSDNASTFGPVFSTNVLAGTSYAGITLTATDANNGEGGFGSYTTPVNLLDLNEGTGLWTTPVTFNIQNEVADFGPAGAEGFGSTLTILAGIASANTTVNLQVRKPNDNEVFGYSTTPPLNDSPGWSSLLSDVFELNGIAATGPSVGGKTPTDVFAVQISYLDNDNPDPESYLEDYVYEHGVASTKALTEAGIFARGELQLAFFNTSTGIYEDDDLGNFNTGTTVVENFNGSYADFVAAQGNFAEADLANYLGSWGVDLVNNNVWAIVDHNTSFAVVPEPQSLAVIGLGGLILCRRPRRRR